MDGAATDFTGASFLSAGHSNMPYADLSALLRGNGVTAVADVRSSPFSRRHPWFDRPALTSALRGDGIAYAFLGRELGGRPARDGLYRDGVADYEAMAREPAFAEGLARLGAGAGRHRIALVCSESDPLCCHRCLLVGRALARAGARLSHLRRDAPSLSQGEVEEELLGRSGRGGDDLFAPRDERLVAAYGARAARVAYAR